MSNGAKEIILGKIKKALANTTAKPFPDLDTEIRLYNGPGNDLAVAFAENFVSLQGQFSYCLDLNELTQQLNVLFTHKDWHRIYCSDPVLRKLLKIEGNGYEDLASCNVAITGCEALVARTGTMVLSAAQPMGRTASVYAPVHVCIAFSSQLVPDVSDAFELLTTKYSTGLPSSISFASGPSRTADIEKTLVTGVHGPKEVFCFLVEG
jgi:L-lactate dehydrogenase complex protein LldG